jgi:RND family efflux transporter MFP subunit
MAVALVFGGRHLLNHAFSPSPVQAQENNESVSDSGPTGTPVEVVHPLKGQMVRTTTQPGTVQAFESVQRYAAVSGYLQKETVDIGDRVKKGQILIKVDVPELEKQIKRYASLVDQARARVKQMKARITSAEAQKKAAEATVKQAEATAKSTAAALRFREQCLRRMKALFYSKSIDEELLDEKTQQRDAALEAHNAALAGIETAKAQALAADAKIEQARADFAATEAEVEVAQAELERAEVLVQYSTIVAPFDGVITQRSLFVGDFVRAATEGGSQVPLVTVQRTDLFRVVVQIPDRDVPYCDPGDPAQVEIDALPGKLFPAKVSRVAESEDPETRLMRVEIDVPNTNGEIRKGMYGRVTITLDKETDQLSIPSSCLVGKSKDGKANVYVFKDGHARLTPIEVRQDDGRRVAVLRGLKERDEVIAHFGSDIANGAAVVVSNPEVHGVVQSPSSH